MADTGDVVSRIYGGFRGADFRGEEVNLARSPDCLNVWKDYTKIDSIRTRPGMRMHKRFDEPVYGIYWYNEKEYAHVGASFYYIPTSGDPQKIPLIIAGLNKEVSLAKRKSNGFVYDGYFYLQDGKNYARFDGTNFVTVYDDYGDNQIAYVPTTTIGGKPTRNEWEKGGGTPHEDVNLLTRWRINTFCGDGKNGYFHLDINSQPHSPIVTVNGQEIPKYNDDGTMNWTVGSDGYIAFIGDAPPAPLTDGQDNVSIKFIGGYSYERQINECTILQVFDNRVFFSGNPEHPNRMWHSSLDNPTYFSDTDYYDDGDASSSISNMVVGNNCLWVFKNNSHTNESIFYHVPTIDAEYGKIYPSSHSNVNIRCIGKAINFSDDIVFFTNTGAKGISGDITTEQAIENRSSLVDRKIKNKLDGYDLSYIVNWMVVEEWNGYLLAFLGEDVFLADSRSIFTKDDHTEYEWFYWELEHFVNCTAVYNNALYLGTYDGGIYTLDDMKCDVPSYWTTPKDKFNVPHKLKTTNKRGCVVEAEGDISVYAKVDDGEFELIGTYENITDYFVSRIKRKKFKDIQLKFCSDKRFSLETATLECWIGGYIKR